MVNDETVWFDVEEVRETEKAYLFNIEGDEMWVPKSQVRGRKKDDGKIVRVELTSWIASQKGLTDPKDDR